MAIARMLTLNHALAELKLAHNPALQAAEPALLGALGTSRTLQGIDLSACDLQDAQAFFNLLQVRCLSRHLLYY